MKTYALLSVFLALQLASGFTPQPQPCTPVSAKHSNENLLLNTVQQAGVALAISLGVFFAPTVSVEPCFAADTATFAKKDISARDFSNVDLTNADFTSAIAKGTSFKGANLAGANFQKANLEKADFTGANLQGAHFENAVLDLSIFKGVTAQKATFSPSILDVADFENADLTDTMWPSTLPLVVCFSVQFVVFVCCVGDCGAHKSIQLFPRNFSTNFVFQFLFIFGSCNILMNDR